MIEFHGKNVVVTGGASGIGKAVVEGIVAGGGHAVILDLNLEAGRAVQKELGEEQVSVYRLNLADQREIREAFALILKELGRIDVLINNAGIVSKTPFEEVTPEEWDRVMNINLTAVYTAISCVFTHMKENHYGRIVNVSSVAAKRGGGFLGNSSYAASKAGVIGFTKAIAREGGPHNICCNAVCPCYTLTPMLNGMSKEIEEKVTESIPLHRGAQPKEVANMILFLASDLASFINGEIADADGGVTMDG